MATRLPDASKNAAANAVVDRIDGGTTNAQGALRIYTGGQVADPDNATTGTLLAEVDLANPAYGAAAAGVAALLGTPLSTTAVDAGTAGWFRVVDRDEATVYDGACRASADPDNGEELVLDNTSIASGQTVNLTALSYTQPESE
jgi:hypothetical protein